MRCWRRMGKISWTDRVRNEEVLLHRVKKERNILRTTERRKANWIGHILRMNCFLKHSIEGRKENEIWNWCQEKKEDVGSYWMTLRKREVTVNWNRKHYNALCGELALEEAMDCRKTDCGMVNEYESHCACNFWTHLMTLMTYTEYPLILIS
jgi:hypothetical protein